MLFQSILVIVIENQIQGETVLSGNIGRYGYKQTVAYQVVMSATYIASYVSGR
jgi:hypothetical protein